MLEEQTATTAHIFHELTFLDVSKNPNVAGKDEETPDTRGFFVFLFYLLSRFLCLSSLSFLSLLIAVKQVWLLLVVFLCVMPLACSQSLFCFPLSHLLITVILHRCDTLTISSLSLLCIN